MSESDHEETPTETPTEQAAESVKTTSKSPWIWLVAGLILAGLLPFGADSVMSNYQVPLPTEFDALSSIPEPNDEQSATMGKLLNENDYVNQKQFMFGVGMVVVIVFGLFAGVISGRVILGVVGAAVGVGVMYLLAMVATPLALDFEQQAISDVGAGDTKAIMLHTLQWATFGIASSVAVLIGFANPGVAVKFLGAALLAAVLGSVLYVIGAAIIDPANKTALAAPVAGTAGYLWTSLIPLLTSLFMARTNQV
ncbi:MAG: hypothetical protein AB8B91_10650 [Rubripirellula sp.]